MVALGPLETAVMEVLWQAEGPMTVREVRGELNRDRHSPLAYTTVMTVLARLAEKDAVIRKARGRGFAYRPAGSDPAALAVRTVLAEHGQAAVAHFVDQIEADPEARDRLRRLLHDSPPETSP
ncbi:BlaI/MecI/CopY family transcriptional regulator [Allosalinactinospora lopnorensis]|uniref:BlaI/MecI/CopY family transcriptional regulator n=1 Tax=Allosalinactinospora lopnorensis TaxID=1352348 RepID=UPI000623EAA9|nr:BlaI/MecI/CopY family transcriptional regulator [Allosalinactinospora lopnorensis]